MVAETQRSALDRALGVVTEVKAGEGLTALLLSLNVFLLLSAYYCIKPVREALILVMESGAQYKSYMSGAIALALLVAVPAYASVARKVAAHKLVVGVTLFFASHLVVFFIASNIPAVARYLGLIFFLWVGIFNMMVVAQFWAFANDVYTEEQGKRLFAMVGLGASVGAAVGSKAASSLIGAIGNEGMLLLAAGLLVICAVLTWVVHQRESQRPRIAKAEEPERRGAFAMVFKHRYLRLIAAFSLIFTLINTNGEFILGKLFAQDANEQAALIVDQQAAELWAKDNQPQVLAYYEDKKASFNNRPLPEVQAEVTLQAARKARAKSLIGQGYGDFFFYVNTIGVLLQMFAVSRIVKYLGFARAFLIFPFIALLSGAAVALFPLLLTVRLGKTAENATDYSLNNTLRNMLWLPTTRDMKYLAKQAVDTFFVRMGDVSSAVLVYLLAELAGLGVQAFALSNLLLIIVWLFLARLIPKAGEQLKAQLGT